MASKATREALGISAVGAFLEGLAKRKMLERERTQQLQDAETQFAHDLAVKKLDLERQQEQEDYNRIKWAVEASRPTPEYVRDPETGAISPTGRLLPGQPPDLLNALVPGALQRKEFRFGEQNGQVALLPAAFGDRGGDFSIAPQKPIVGPQKTGSSAQDKAARLKAQAPGTISALVDMYKEVGNVGLGGGGLLANFTGGRYGGGTNAPAAVTYESMRPTTGRSLYMAISGDTRGLNESEGKAAENLMPSTVARFGGAADSSDVAIKKFARLMALADLQKLPEFTGEATSPQEAGQRWSAALARSSEMAPRYEALVRAQMENEGAPGPTVDNERTMEIEARLKANTARLAELEKQGAK